MEIFCSYDCLYSDILEIISPSDSDTDLVPSSQGLARSVTKLPTSNHSSFFREVNNIESICLEDDGSKPIRKFWNYLTLEIRLT